MLMALPSDTSFHVWAREAPARHERQGCSLGVSMLKARLLRYKRLTLSCSAATRPIRRGISRAATLSTSGICRQNPVLAFSPPIGVKRLLAARRNFRQARRQRLKSHVVVRTPCTAAEKGVFSRSMYSCCYLVLGRYFFFQAEDGI